MYGEDRMTEKGVLALQLACVESCLQFPNWMDSVRRFQGFWALLVASWNQERISFPCCYRS